MGRRRAFRRVLYGRTKYGTDSSDNGGLLLAYYSLSVPSAFPSSSLPTSFSLSSSFSSSGFTAIDVSISYRRMGTCPNINRDLGALFVFFLLSFLFFSCPSRRTPTNVSIIQPICLLFVSKSVVIGMFSFPASRHSSFVQYSSDLFYEMRMKSNVDVEIKTNNLNLAVSVWSYRSHFTSDKIDRQLTDE